jgi:uncharacterized protein YecE (DUF72 family)
MGCKKKREKKIYIGTSGWYYDQWKGVFYPGSFSNGKLLSYYAERLKTVEVNNSFYRLPREKTFNEWGGQTPEEFVFAVKGSRYITHMKKLKCGKRPINNFLNAVNGLGRKVGPIVFQLPPAWGKNTRRLEEFLSILPDGYRYSFEFRNPEWFSEDTYEQLNKKGAAFCIYDLNRKLSPRIVTSDFVYLRLHGPDGAYKGSYSKRKLMEWADTFKAWRKKGLDVYCYFDNDQNGYAIRNAMELEKMI